MNNNDPNYKAAISMLSKLILERIKAKKEQSKPNPVSNNPTPKQG